MKKILSLHEFCNFFINFTVCFKLKFKNFKSTQTCQNLKCKYVFKKLDILLSLSKIIFKGFVDLWKKQNINCYKTTKIRCAFETSLKLRRKFLTKSYCLTIFHNEFLFFSKT